VVSTLGLALGLVGVALLGISLSILVFVVPGITMGAAQWLFLRSLPGSRTWILGTSLGLPFLALGVAAVVIPYVLSTGPVFGGPPMPATLALDPRSSLVPAIFSIPLGLTQHAFLRRNFKRAGWWIPGTFVGWFVATLLLYPDYLNSTGTAWPIFLLALSIPPAITGTILLSLSPKQAALGSFAKHP
jgi:hypothetical protein